MLKPSQHACKLQFQKAAGQGFGQGSASKSRHSQETKHRPNEAGMAGFYLEQQRLPDISSDAIPMAESGSCHRRHCHSDSRSTSTEGVLGAGAGQGCRAHPAASISQTKSFPGTLRPDTLGVNNTLPPKSLQLRGGKPLHRSRNQTGALQNPPL